MNDYFMSSIWGIPFLSFITAGVGAYIGGYLKKRGENLATKEDFNDLKAQTAALTETTKEIESKIEDKIWDRQKQWEMKKEVLFEAVKRLSAAENALLEMQSSVLTEATALDRVEWQREYQESAHRWTAATTALDESRLFAAVTCSRETRDAIDEFGALCNDVASSMRGNPSAYQNAIEQIHRSFWAARGAIRRELGVPPTPQSN